MARELLINTDGSCIRNPGPGGFAAIVEWDEKELITVSGGHPDTTNNHMELSAVIEALKATEEIPALLGRHITVRTDSEYVCNAFNKSWLKTWKSKGTLPNRELWQLLDRLTAGRTITWTWVRGHTGDPRNEQCDTIAREQAELAKHISEP